MVSCDGQDKYTAPVCGFCFVNIADAIKENSGSVKAAGKVTAEGFVVFKGAAVNEKTAMKSLSAGIYLGIKKN